MGNKENIIYSNVAVLPKAWNIWESEEYSAIDSKQYPHEGYRVSVLCECMLQSI